MVEVYVVFVPFRAEQRALVELQKRICENKGKFALTSRPGSLVSSKRDWKDRALMASERVDILGFGCRRQTR